MNTSDEVAPVTGALSNFDGSGSIYITTDKSFNAPKLTLKNNSAGEIRLPAGTAVPFGSLLPGQSAIYLAPSGLLTNDELSAIVLKTGDWTSNHFVDSRTGLGYLVFAPDQEVCLEPNGGTLPLELADVLAAAPARSGMAALELAGALGVRSADARVPLFLDIAAVSGAELDLGVGFSSGDTVYVGDDATLVLYLSNPGKQALVPGGVASWEDDPPEFQLTLIYGDGQGALASAADAAQIDVTLKNGYGNRWAPVQKRVQGVGPVWLMQPDRAGPGTVLGTADQASTEFTIAGIHAAQLPSGLDAAITLAYVSWRRIPNYRDGTTALVITKHAGPSVVCFYATPPVVPYGQQTVPTILTWKTTNADVVTFEDVPTVSSEQTFLASGSGPLSAPVEIARGASIEVTAQKDLSPSTLKSPPRELIVPGVSRTDVPLGGRPGTPVLATPRGSNDVFAFRAAHPGFARVDLSHRAAVAPGRLDRMVTPPCSVVGVYDAIPDGSRLHVAVVPSSGLAWIVSVDVASAKVTAQVCLKEILSQKETPAFVTLALTPDGTLYVAGTMGTPAAPTWTGLWTIDAASYWVKDYAAWAPVAGAGALVATRGSQLIALTKDDRELVVVGPSAFKPRGYPGPLVAARLAAWALPVASADASRVYVPAFDVGNRNDEGRPAMVLAVFDTASMSLVEKLMVTWPQGADWYPALSSIITSRRLALAPDESSAYMVLPWQDGTVAAIDLRTGTAQVWPCGHGGFAPETLVARNADVVCADANSLLAIVGLDPADAWPPAIGSGPC